jgi:TctA family transporter
LLKLPYRVLFPAILVFCVIGVYSLDGSLFDVWTLALFGAVGYLWSRLGCESAPLLLGLVLGQMMETNFRRALLLARGDFMTFLTRPISLSLLIVAAGLLLLIALPVIRRKRQEAFVEE